MSKYNLEKLHAACVAWAKEPVWKDWQVQAKLKVGIGIFMDAKYAEIVEPNNESLASIYIDLPKDQNTQIFTFAALAGIDIESFKVKEWTYKSAVLDAIEKASGKYEFNSEISTRKNGTRISIFFGDMELMDTQDYYIPEMPDWAQFYTILRLDLTGLYPIENPQTEK
jgi:hypothetical protein